MEVEKIDSRKNAKKPESDIESSFGADFKLIIQTTLEDALEEVRSQIKGVSIDFKTSMRGMEKEIKEIKKLAKRNRGLLVNLAGKPSVEEKEPELISTGFDILTKVPSHLRRTYKVMLTKESGATASEVASETEKSRPLESDYLNQLFEKGLLRKKMDPNNSRKIIFTIKSQDDYKEDDESNNSYLSHSLLNKVDMISHRKKTVQAANENSTPISKNKQK
ncbi:MAG: hypothetical protein ACW98F_15045 [Candidatus Hodarchaeales archaeon]|jgi:hypothetical protein